MGGFGQFQRRTTERQQNLVVISVIIPTRDRLGFLKEAISSVQAQTYSDWEAIVIDDASTDGTWQWLASLGEGRIRGVHLERHCERSAARNRGVREAGGELVLFLDDDDRLKPHALACLSAELEQHPDAIAAIGGRVYFDDRGQGQEFTLSNWRVKRVIWPEILFGLVPAQGEALIRKSTLIATSGWMEHLALAEDHEFWLRLVRLGPVVMIPDTVLEVRVHAGQSPRTGLRGRTKDFRRAFVNNLPPESMVQGERAFEAFRCNQAGQRAFGLGDYKLSLKLYARVIRRAPFLLCSPLSRPYILIFFFKSLGGYLFGSRVVVLVRRFRRQVRSTIRRVSACTYPDRTL